MTQWAVCGKRPAADTWRHEGEAGSRRAALLSDEIGFVEDYLGVARERYENTLSFEYRVPGHLMSVAVPPLLLQPLVENSLKHGCPPGSEPLHLALGLQHGRLAMAKLVLGSLSGCGSARIGNIEIPVIGRVSMDLVTLDISAVPDDKAGVGTWVELIWGSKMLDELAARAGTIGYELLTALGGRYPRVYRSGEDA